MPAAMMHGGGGVLLMMTTKFALNETNEKYNNCTKQLSKPLILTTQNTAKQQHKEICKNNHANKHAAPSNQLTEEKQYFQMRKMDQR